jgi:hypothetical protein
MNARQILRPSATVFIIVEVERPGQETRMLLINP